MFFFSLGRVVAPVERHLSPLSPHPHEHTYTPFPLPFLTKRADSLHALKNASIAAAEAAAEAGSAGGVADGSDPTPPAPTVEEATRTLLESFQTLDETTRALEHHTRGPSCRGGCGLPELL